MNSVVPKKLLLTVTVACFTKTQAAFLFHTQVPPSLTQNKCRPSISKSNISPMEGVVQDLKTIHKYRNDDDDCLPCVLADTTDGDDFIDSGVDGLEVPNANVRRDLSKNDYDKIFVAHKGDDILLGVVHSNMRSIELLSGRIFMIVALILFTTEILTGKSLPEQVGLYQFIN